MGTCPPAMILFPRFFCRNTVLTGLVCLPSGHPRCWLGSSFSLYFFSPDANAIVELGAYGCWGQLQTTLKNSVSAAWFIQSLKLITVLPNHATNFLNTENTNWNLTECFKAIVLANCGGWLEIHLVLYYLIPLIYWNWEDLAASPLKIIFFSIFIGSFMLFEALKIKAVYIKYKLWKMPSSWSFIGYKTS